MDRPQDDWFPQAEAAAGPPDPSQPEEDWLVETGLPQRSTFDLSSVGDRRILVPVAIVAIFFIAVLAAFGAWGAETRSGAARGLLRRPAPRVDRLRLRPLHTASFATPKRVPAD